MTQASRRPTIRRKPAPGAQPSRSTLSRQRERAGLVKVWLPRDAIEDLLIDCGVLGEWDCDSDDALQDALLRYLAEKTGEF